jgi:hypothetical protein
MFPIKSLACCLKFPVALPSLSDAVCPPEVALFALSPILPVALLTVSLASPVALLNWSERLLKGFEPSIRS